MKVLLGISHDPASNSGGYFSDIKLQETSLYGFKVFGIQLSKFRMQTPVINGSYLAETGNHFDTPLLEGHIPSTSFSFGAERDDKVKVMSQFFG